MSSSRPAAYDIIANGPPVTRMYMDGAVLEQAIQVLVHHYDIHEDHQKHLRCVANVTKFAPTVDQVEWVADQANLRHATKKINLWMFPYMEFYPWYVRSKDGEHRLYLGAFIRYDGMSTPLWLGFTTGSETRTYLCGPGDNPNGQTGFFRVDPPVRRYVTWWPPFDLFFGLAFMSPEDSDDTNGHKNAESHQDEYFRATMKVLARFPSLIMENEPNDPKVRRQVYDDLSAYPFRSKEEFATSGPLTELFKLLCEEVGGMHEAQSDDDKESLGGQEDDADEE